VNENSKKRFFLKTTIQSIRTYLGSRLAKQCKIIEYNTKRLVFITWFYVSSVTYEATYKLTAVSKVV